LAKTPSARFATVTEFLEALLTAEDRGAASPSNSIAVLAFQNMSAEAENEYLSDGLSEEVINALSRIERFRVAARTSSFAYKGSNEDIRTIGQRLGVRSVLEGSVRKASDRLRVTAQLINVEDGYHLWSERYDSDMEDVFAIQDQIAQNIAAALEVVLSEDDKRALQTARTADIQAYDYYLRGRQFFRQFRKKSLQFAKEMFTRAIEVDPDYALAHTGVADSCSYLHMYWRTGEADLQQADRSSRRALELDPDLAEAHASRGLIANLLRNFDEAEQEFQTAIALKPNLWQAHYYYGRVCFQQGKLEQAVSLFEGATQWCEDWEARFFAAQSYAAMHREEDADAAYRLALRVTEEHLELNPDDARAATMAAVAACRVGQRDRGLEWARKAFAIDPTDAGVSYNVACVYALEGIKDEAFTCLEAARRGGFWHPDWISNDPDLDSLRDDPRFEALLKEDS
jgi:TolB-like protein/Flp pilus assembly protein TadD